MGIGGASKQGAFSIGVGQRMYLHLGSFTQLEEAGYTNPNILTVEVQSVRFSQGKIPEGLHFHCKLGFSSIKPCFFTICRV